MGRLKIGSSSSDHHHSTQLAQHHEMQHNDQINHHQNNNHMMFSFGMMQSSSSSIPVPFNISKESGAYDLGDLDQALFLYLDGQDHSAAQDQRQNSGMRPHTLNIFPSEPMHVEPSPKGGSGSKKLSEPSNPRNDVQEPAKVVKREGNRKGPTSSSEQDGPKTPDPKTLRRLAQNREAARKSRLRKKAYVQQLETSRMKLTQLEHEIQRARAQGFFLGGNANAAGEQGLPCTNITSDAAWFDMEYARWLEEHHRLTVELRSAVHEHRPEDELGILIDNCLAHYDQIISLKNVIVKSDVFHIVSGMWRTPAERCFLWIGGFRPSELIKIILNQVEPLTEQQMVGIYGLQQSTQEAEEALTHGLDALNQSLTETIVCDTLTLPPNMNTYMAQMAVAINKLTTLEGFVTQADNLRQQTLHRLQQVLTTRQAARCFLAIGEYFHRLRALSSLWLSRPRQD
ncbi:bZIP transcription factor TGA10-like isoform X2 [Salvia miltiorrhiza]|uniref:bZIP transcription factor TGA10-like isoform X2 n=1 Tax=Salvia miltiorrhiza TaxID=226208 RepID=UPI0025AD5653|nr:bZIP transcription factor TGA10-like isoform X2 [Salvia miltiorrhiza]